MPRGPMTASHKKAIAQGRRESSAVKNYLESLVGSQGRRAADPAAIRRRLNNVESKLAGEKNRLRQVELVQQRLNLQAALGAAQKRSDDAELVSRFVEVAASYGKRRGISYRAWRAVGVPADVLKKAGISRGV